MSSYYNATEKDCLERAKMYVQHALDEVIISGNSAYGVSRIDWDERKIHFNRGQALLGL